MIRSQSGNTLPGPGSGHVSVYVTKHVDHRDKLPGPMSLLSVFLVGIVTIDTMTHDTSPDCSFEKVSDFSQSKINKQMTEFAFGCLLFQRNLITEEY